MSLVRRPVSLLALVLMLPAAGAAFADVIPADHAARMSKGLDLFKSDVRQVLLDNCSKCHGGTGGAKGGLDLSTRESLLQGGHDGPARRDR
jgi:mono/diheme cytochrome c family protein